MSGTRRSLRDYDCLPDRIRQHRQADSRGILVVEGPSDHRLITRVSNSSWAIFIAGNRNAVIATVVDTQKLQVERTAGLVDRDFDEVVKVAQEEGLPVYSFDQADLEAALLVLPFFNAMVEEFGSSSKIEGAGGSDSLRRTAIGIAVVVGRVRRASMERNWGINFEDLDFTNKVDSRSLTLSVPKLVNSILPRLESNVEKEYLREISCEFNTSVYAEDASFRERDALHVVRLGLQRIYGNSSISNTEDLAVCDWRPPQSCSTLPHFHRWLRL